MDVCRFCLSKDELQPLFSKISEKKKPKFSKLLEEVTSTVVSQSDGLSMMVCKDCLGSIRKYEAFRKQCRRSHNHLKKQFIKQVLQLEDKFIKEPNIEVNEGSETELEFALSDDFKHLLKHLEPSDLDAECDNEFRKKLKYLEIADDTVDLELRFVKIKRNIDNTEILLSYLDKHVSEKPDLESEQTVNYGTFGDDEDVNIMVVETTNRNEEFIVMDHCEDNKKRIKRKRSADTHEKDSAVDEKHDDSVGSQNYIEIGDSLDPLDNETQVIEDIVTEEDPITTNDERKFMTIVTEFPSTSSEPDLTEVKLKVLAGKELHKYVINGYPNSGTKENEDTKLSQKYDWKALSVEPITGYSRTEVYECSVCAKKLKGYSVFYHHALTHFPPEFCCPECGKCFHEKRNMETHRVRRHNAEKRFLCHHCDFRACSKPELLVHERKSHTGERPYKCECGATFYSLQCKRQHERKHLTVKNYKCKSCPKVFKSQAELSAHNRRTHKYNYRYLCYLCPREFCTHGAVRAHLTRVHNVPREEQTAITHEVDVSSPSSKGSDGGRL